LGDKFGWKQNAAWLFVSSRFKIHRAFLISNIKANFLISSVRTFGVSV